MLDSRASFVLGGAIVVAVVLTLVCTFLRMRRVGPDLWLGAVMGGLFGGAVGNAIWLHHLDGSVGYFLREAVEADPEYVAWMNAQPNEDAAEKKFFVMMSDSVVRLEDDDLLGRAEIISRALSQATTKDCAAIARGDAKAMTTAIDAMPMPDRQRWARQLANGALAHFHGRPVAPIRPVAIASAASQLRAQIPSGDIERFSGVWARLSVAPDDDACWCGRTLFDAAFRLPRDVRVTLLRSVLTGKWQ